MIKTKTYIKRQKTTLLEKEILTKVNNVLNTPEKTIQNQES